MYTHLDDYPWSSTHDVMILDFIEIVLPLRRHVQAISAGVEVLIILSLRVSCAYAWSTRIRILSMLRILLYFYRFVVDRRCVSVDVELILVVSYRQGTFTIRRPSSDRCHVTRHLCCMGLCTLWRSIRGVVWASCVYLVILWLWLLLDIRVKIIMRLIINIKNNKFKR